MNATTPLLLSLVLSAPAALAHTVEMHKVTPEGIGESLGTVELTDGPDGLVLTPKLKGLGGPVHGFHVHEKPSCEPGMKSGGTKEWYYRYRLGGSDRLQLIGRYARESEPGLGLYNLVAAREAAQALAMQVKQGIDPKEHAQQEAARRQQAEAERRQRDAEARRRAELEARKGSFGQLLGAYAGTLRAAGKASAYDVANLFAIHVQQPVPTLTARKAAEIEPADIQAILARMVGLGIGRRINMARAYLRAAFAWAGKNDHDPRRLAADGVVFALKGNPVDLIPVLKGEEHDRVGERALSDAELRYLWQAVADRYPSQRALVQLALLLGGQRPKQLLAATWSCYDPEQAMRRRGQGNPDRSCYLWFASAEASGELVYQPALACPKSLKAANLCPRRQSLGKSTIPELCGLNFCLRPSLWHCRFGMLSTGPLTPVSAVFPGHGPVHTIRPTPPWRGSSLLLS